MSENPQIECVHTNVVLNPQGRDVGLFAPIAEADSESRLLRIGKATPADRPDDDIQDDEQTDGDKQLGFYVRMK